MNFTSFITDRWVEAISMTVLHSLWQFSILAVALYVIKTFIKVKSPGTRYTLNLAALIAALGMALYTFYAYFSVPATSPSTTTTDSIIYTLTEGQAWLPTGFSIQAWLGEFYNRNALLITQLWIIGVCLYAARLFIGLSYLGYIHQPSSHNTHSKLQAQLDTVIEKMKVTHQVIIRTSSRITSPLTYGFYKNVILFPVGLINHLSTDEVEAIIAHELAHIQRHDWMINILQSFIEVLFFYHPVIWWLSQEIRQEREYACDDLALKHIPHKLTYAKTLLKIKEMEVSSHYQLTMNFSNHHKYTFMKRINRILGLVQGTGYLREKVIALLLIFAVAGAFASSGKLNNYIHIPFLSSQDI